MNRTGIYRVCIAFIAIIGVVFFALAVTGCNNGTTDDKKPEIRFCNACGVCGSCITSTWNGTSVNYSWYEDGENPYTITTAAQLKGLANIVNGDDGRNQYDFDGEVINLNANISLGNHLWEPIGFGETFNGTFDGNGKNIINLKVNKPEDEYIGFFGEIGSNGIVRNLNVSGTVTGQYSVGGIVGCNYGGLVENCSFSGTVTGEYFIGGIVGDNYLGTVENCRNSGTISGLEKIGGIVGSNITSTVKNCYNTGNISGENDVGGIAGNNYESTVENCYNRGNVSGINDIGGVAGKNQGTVKNCYNTGNVSGAISAGARVGGVAGGNFQGTVEYCYNTGAVSGRYEVGGIVGQNPTSGTVRNNVSLGKTVTATTEDVARVVGQDFSGTLTNNKARANMTPSGTSDADGIHGESVTVTGSGTANSSVFSGWSSSIWNIPSGNLTVGGNLPTLKGVTQNPAPKLP